MTLLFFVLNLSFLKGDIMARKIVITSGKGGVGKTTVCANLGYALAQKQLKVLLVDADIGLNNLDVVLGVENKIVYDLMDIVSGRCRPKQALVQDFFAPNLYVLPSNRTYCSLDLDGEGIKEILNQFDDYFDYILIDCPAGIESGFLRAIKCANESIVVTTPHLSAIRDADKVVSILQTYGLSIYGTIVNRARGDLIIDGEMLDIDSIAKYLKIEVVGVIPDDDHISYQLLSGGELKRKAESYLAFNYVVEKLHNGENKIYDCTRKYKGVIGEIKRRIKRWV